MERIFFFFQWNLKGGSLDTVDNMVDNTSKTITNRYGDNGSPCLKPLAPLKKPQREPLTFTEKKVVVMQALIPKTNLGGNLSSLRAANKKSHETESKALLMSIFIAQRAGP